MKEIYQISKKGLDDLPFNIILAIRLIADKNYGFKFISKETGKELSRESLVGLLAIAIRKTLLETK